MSKRVLGWVAFLFLSACSATPKSVTPLTAANSNYLATEDEKKLIGQSNELHREFIKRGVLLNDIEADAYINSVGRRLIPTFGRGPTIHFYILKDATINAMALPNGNIYVNVGLIGRLDCEDQLALVLAHETTHVIQRHALKRQLDRHKSVVAAHVTDLLLLGTGLSYIPFSLDIASFSREQETEADLLGLEYTANNNYDLERSIQVFDKLDETKHTGQSTSAWADHPELKARKIYSLKKITSLSSTVISNESASVSFENFRKSAAVIAIQLRLLNGQYELARDAIDYELAKAPNSPDWHVYKGDAWREAAEHPDSAAREYAWLYEKKINDALLKQFSGTTDTNFQVASEQYKEALKISSSAPRAYRGLGLIAYKKNQKTTARDYLVRYLSMESHPTDKRFIENIIVRIDSEN